MLATAPDGANIFYEVYDFTEPWRPAETVLLHHGLRANHGLWYAWIPLLAREFRVVAVDARGRGASTIPGPGFDWSLEQFAADDLAVADAVGAERFHWIGNSFGSVVGEYAAATHGDRLRTLVLTSAPYRFDHLKDVIDGWIADYHRLGSREFLMRDVRNMFPAGADPALMNWHAEQLAQVSDHVATDMLRYMATINLADLVPRIRVPTLILAARASDRAPATEAEFMRSRIPNCELVTLDGQHNVVFTEPERCAAIVLDFLRRHHGAQRGQ